MRLAGSSVGTSPGRTVRLLPGRSAALFQSKHDVKQLWFERVLCVVLLCVSISFFLNFIRLLSVVFPSYFMMLTMKKAVSL